MRSLATALLSSQINPPRSHPAGAGQWRPPEGAGSIPEAPLPALSFPAPHPEWHQGTSPAGQGRAGQGPAAAASAPAGQQGKTECHEPDWVSWESSPSIPVTQLASALAEMYRIDVQGTEAAVLVSGTIKVCAPLPIS